MKISALILAKNEAEMISDCVDQLDFVDEILLLDQGSTDETVTLAKSNKKVSILTNFSNQFDKDRNILMEAAKHEWLLYVDADERFEKQTIEEIKTIVRSGTEGTYFFPRKNIILGKWLKNGGWWPDFVPRLFNKKNLEKWEGQVHESPKITGSVFHCKNPITHLTARSISIMFKKSIRWAKIEAQLYAKAKSPQVTKLKILKRIIAEFAQRYIVKKGFLDGRIGLIQAIYQALHKGMVLTYLWEIQNKTEERVKYFK